ncbi:hypothetical protein LPJ61_005057 [Coemansia biformis]|uniref:Proteasome assembly chaperone 2 n=1 Tax=Coemansia biformis TaxID=1286918 RepID=A0A9W8CWZ8_9FUNG|nr:hypothetical protein LPJ61_005057 [Coemansia biformis]
MTFVKSNSAAATKGSTLVLPSVSIGNVPQLAVDLLVNTLQATRIGIIDSPSTLPVSGPSGFDHLPGQRSVPVEVYQTADGQWTIVQQRSPPLPGRHRVFARELMDFIAQGDFAKVVLLTSSDAALRADALIQGPQIRSLTVNWQDDELASQLQALSLGPLDVAGETGTGPKEPLKQLHAAGAAKHLLRLCQATDIPVVALVALVNEGDNVPDAIGLANAANALLDIAPGAAQWRPPQSWQWLSGPVNPPGELY